MTTGRNWGILAGILMATSVGLLLSGHRELGLLVAFIAALPTGLAIEVMSR